MQFNAERTLLYVACGDDDVIDVIDVATLQVADQIPTARSPEAFILNRAGTMIYVSNEENSTCQFIDVQQKLIVHEVPTGAEPEGVFLSEDEATLYVTSEVADMVHVIDVARGVTVDNIIVGTRPRRFATTLDARELWVSDELSGTVSIIDRATNVVLEQISFLPPGFRPVDVTPVGLVRSADGTTMYVSLGRANHVAYVNVATRAIEGYTLVGSRAWNVTLNRDESRLYVANGLSDDLSIIQLPQRRNIRSIAIGRVPYSVVIDE
jgi:PQQ-dependent catabolism-associated beta-propeller protein